MNSPGWLCGLRGAERLKTSLNRADNKGVEQISTTVRNRMRQALAETPFRTPHVWLKPGVLVASVGINLLALAMPMLIFQVYNRIIPMQATDTFILLVAGMLGVVVLDALLKILRTVALNFPDTRSCRILVDGAQVETLAGHLNLGQAFDPRRWL